MFEGGGIAAVEYQAAFRGQKGGNIRDVILMRVKVSGVLARVLLCGVLA